MSCVLHPPHTEILWALSCVCTAETSGSCRGTWRHRLLHLVSPDRQRKEVMASIHPKTSKVWVSVILSLKSFFMEFDILKSPLANFYNFASPVQTHLQSQRALLLQGSESLNNASQSIQRSQQIANETEQIGNDIIEELGEQREQLDRTRNRVRISFT